MVAFLISMSARASKAKAVLLGTAVLRHSAEASWLLCSYITQQMPIKSLTPNRHFHLIKWIFGDVIREQLIHFPHDQIHIGLLWLREQQELDSANGLERGQAEQ